MENVFSKNADVYPLGKWYGPSAKLEDVDLSSMFVLSKDCNTADSQQYKIYDRAGHTPLLFDLIKNNSTQNINPKWKDFDEKLDDNQKASDSDYILMIFVGLFILALLFGLVYGIYGVVTL